MNLNQITGFEKVSQSSVLDEVQKLFNLYKEHTVLCCGLIIVLTYRERACAHYGGCDSRLQFPFVCVHISLVASYSPPSESSVRERGETKRGEREKCHFSCDSRIKMYLQKSRHHI